MNARPKKLVDRWIFVGLLLLLFALPLPAGSVWPWAATGLSTLALALLCLWWLLYLTGKLKPHLEWYMLVPLLLWLIWLVYVALQLLPLSPALLASLSPHSLALHQAAAQLAPGFVTEQAKYPISVDSGKTATKLVLSLGYFAVFSLLLLTVSGHRSRMRLVAEAIVIAATLQALYGSIMVLSGIEYGPFQVKEFYRGFATGTFVNRNNLAGYLELGAAAGMGLILADLHQGGGHGWRAWLNSLLETLFSRKMRVRVFLGVMVIGVVLTRSRMGNTAFFVSLFGCGGLYLLLRERRLFLKGALLFASFLVVDLFIVNHWFGLEKVVNRIETTQSETEIRTYANKDYPQVIEDYWKTGSGLGSFGDVYQSYQSFPSQNYFEHAHNDYAEILIDAGLSGLLLLLALAGFTVWHALRVITHRRDRLMTGISFTGLMAVVAMGIHAWVSFNLQIPANAATLVALMALALCCSPRQNHGQRRRSSRSDVSTHGTGADASDRL